MSARCEGAHDDNVENIRVKYSCSGMNAVINRFAVESLIPSKV